MLKPKRILRLIYQLLIGATVLALLISYSQSQASEINTSRELTTSKEFTNKFKSFKYFNNDYPFEINEIISLNDEPNPLGNKLKIINVWATWCLPCVKELPTLDRLAKDNKNNKIEIIALCVDFDHKPERIKNFIENLGVDSNLIRYDRDGEIRKWMDQEGLLNDGLPLTIVVTQDNKILFTMLGEADWSSEEARGFVDTVIKNESD